MTSVVTLPLIVLLATPGTDGAVPAATNAEQLYAKAREVDADDPFRKHHEMAVKAWTAFVATDAPPDEKRDAYLRLAESQMALQDAASALESIEHAIRFGLETAKVHCLRGTILIRQGSREAALAAIQRTLEIDPSYAPAYLAQAEWPLAEAPQQAGEYIKKAVELDPDDPRGYLFRAMWHAAAGRYADAAEDCDRCLSMQPLDSHTRSEAHIIKAGMLFHLGDHNGALANALFARRLNPDSQSAAAVIGAAGGEAGHYTLAYYVSDRLLNNNADSAKLFETRGAALMEMRRYDEALRDFQRALTLDPDALGALRLRGTLCAALGDYDRALDDFRHAMRLDEGDAITMCRSAVLLATCASDQYRDGTEAMVLAKRACELTENKQSMAIAALACAHAELGEYPEAVDVLTHIPVEVKRGNDTFIDQLVRLFRAEMPLRRSPKVDGMEGGSPLAMLEEVKHSLVRVGLEPESERMLGVCNALLEGDSLASPVRRLVFEKAGRCLLLLGRFQEAEQRFTQTIQLGPETPTLCWLRARCALESGKLAVEDLDRALQLDARFVPSYALLGEIGCAAKRFDDARRLVDRALALDPSYAPAHAYQAMILAGQQPDHPAELLEALNLCLELDPLPDMEKSATATYGMRSVAFRDLGNHRAALANAYIAYRLEPQTPIHAKLVRDAYDEMGKKLLAAEFDRR